MEPEVSTRLTKSHTCPVGRPGVALRRPVSTHGRFVSTNEAGAAPLCLKSLWNLLHSLERRPVFFGRRLRRGIWGISGYSALDSCDAPSWQWLCLTADIMWFLPSPGSRADDGDFWGLPCSPATAVTESGGEKNPLELMIGGISHTTWRSLSLSPCCPASERETRSECSAFPLTHTSQLTRYPPIYSPSSYRPSYFRLVLQRHHTLVQESQGDARVAPTVSVSHQVNPCVSGPRATHGPLSLQLIRKNKVDYFCRASFIC